MDPKCTGMWGALETKPPSEPNKAHEKSNLSFIFVEIAVLSRTLKELNLKNNTKKLKESKL